MTHIAAHPTLDEQTVADSIRSFIVENFLFGDAKAAPSDDTSLIERDIVDSTGILELVAFVEDTFHFAVPDAEIVPAHFDTIARVRAYVLARAPGGDALGIRAA